MQPLRKNSTSRSEFVPSIQRALPQCRLPSKTPGRCSRPRPLLPRCDSFGSGSAHSKAADEMPFIWERALPFGRQFVVAVAATAIGEIERPRLSRTLRSFFVPQIRMPMVSLWWSRRRTSTRATSKFSLPTYSG